MAQLVAERGEEAATVARVVELASVPRATFYEHFEDRSDCLSAALDELASRAAEEARAACAGRHGWSQRIRAGLRALLEVLDENPELARVCVAQAVSSGLSRCGLRGELLEELVPVLEEGRDLAPADRQPPPGAAMSVIGGTLGMIHARLLGSGQPPLVDLLNPLMAMVVLPYLGEAAALGELARPKAGEAVSHALERLRELDDAEGGRQPQEGPAGQP